MTDDTNPTPERFYHDTDSEIWCPTTGETVSSTMAGPPDFCPHCGDINHLDTTTPEPAAAAWPVPVVAPGPDNPVVCDDVDWARAERDMHKALGLKVPMCQAVTGGLTCTRIHRHTGPHAAGTGDAVVGVWDEPGPAATEPDIRGGAA